MDKKGIFFDLYGTLFIFGDMTTAWNDWANTYYETLTKCGHKIQKDNLYESLSGFFSKPRPDIDNQELTLYEYRLRNHCSSINLELATDELQQLSASTITAWQNHILLDNETIPVLKKLKENFTIALVSNFDHPPHIYSLLSNLELISLFDEIIISGEVGYDKPHTKIFETALTQTKRKADEVLFVGDSVEDMEGAKAVGLTPVLINRERNSENSVLIDFQSDPDSIEHVQPTPDKNGVIEISSLNELLTIVYKVEQNG